MHYTYMDRVQSDSRVGKQTGSPSNGFIQPKWSDLLSDLLQACHGQIPDRVRFDLLLAFANLISILKIFPTKVYKINPTLVLAVLNLCINLNLHAKNCHKGLQRHTMTQTKAWWRISPWSMGDTGQIYVLSYIIFRERRVLPGGCCASLVGFLWRDYVHQRETQRETQYRHRVHQDTWHLDDKPENTWHWDRYI